MSIFSKLPPGLLRDIWVLIKEDDPVFQQSGLKKTSLLKAEKIAVVHESVFQRKLGSLPPDTILQAQVALKRALLIP